MGLLLLVVGIIGCSSSRRSSIEPVTAPLDPPPAGVTQDKDTRDRITDDLGWTRHESDDFLDDLGVRVDSLANAPDISDSLAALTKARLLSVDEIFDYPVVVNRRVLAWIDFYLGKGRVSINRSLKRSGRYLALSRRIFAEERIPQDLVFLGHVESGFRYNARSHARALGLWQFMRGTARLYGLQCDGYVDERLDPEKATRAAAQHLRDLHEKYDDWFLALAAYNAGSGKVDKAIRRAGTRDFWQIAQTRYLRRETRNFVPAILAATILAKSPGAYGLTEETDPPLEYDTAPVDSPTDVRIVAQCIDVSTAKIQDLNPCILQLQTPPKSKSFDVHVPKGMGETFARELARIPVERRLLFHRHKVRRGETLGQLARNYKTTVRAIQDANGMGRRTTIYAGRTLQIPARDFPEDHLADLHYEDGIQHRVRKGEFLGEIARRYGVTVPQLQSANGISNPSRIHPGDLLTIPTRAKRSEGDPSSRDGSAEPKHVASGATAGVPGNVSVPSKPQSRPLRGVNTSDSLGRVPTTAHIVEDAREAIKEEESNPPPESRVHVVRKGDTLSDIADQHGVKLSDLRRWNSLGRRSRIYPGQEIIVQGRGTGSRAPSSRDFFLHIVKSGESLWKIARRYGVRVMDLARWNNLRRSATIHPGQSLRIY